MVIVKDRGKQISGMDVKLLRWDDVNWRYEVVKSVQSDVDGRALFSGAPLGEYRVRAVSGAFMRALTKEPLSADVSLTKVGTNRIGSRTVADQRGRFRFDAVEPGRYVLSISERTEEQGYVGMVRDMVFESIGIQQQHRRLQHAHIYGNIQVEVNQNARDRELSLGAVSMTSCGMSYEPDGTAGEIN